MKIGRVAMIAVAVIVLLVIGVVVGGVVFVDRIAREGVERGGTYALGVKTELDGASIGILSGNVALSGLDVANPQGFEKDPYFLRLGRGDVNVSLASLSKDVVEVPRLVLENVAVTLIKGDKGANYKIILDNLERLKSTKEQPRPAEGGKKFVVREIVIKDVKVKVDALGIGGGLTSVNVAVDEIKVENVGTGAEGGIPLPEVAGVVVHSILAGAIAKGGGLIPEDIAGDLKGKLAALETLGGDTVKVLTQTGGNFVEIGKDLGKDLEKTVTDVQKEAESVVGGFKDLLGKPRTDDKKTTEKKDGPK